MFMPLFDKVLLDLLVKLNLLRGLKITDPMLQSSIKIKGAEMLL